MTLVVVDAGGTNIRFGMADSIDAPLRDVQNLTCAGYAGIGDAITAYLDGAGSREGITAFCIAIAGVNLGDAWDVTNNHWQFGKDELRAATGASTRMLLINDFTAQALAHSAKDAPEKMPVHQGEAGREDAALLVIGPGTGLGVAALVPAGDDGFIPVRGEGGHAGFSPRDGRERELDAFMRDKTGEDFISTEHVLSGRGLEAIYEFVSGETRTAAEITGSVDSDDNSREAAFIMLGVLGGAVADNALALGCWRGAVITGGIVPRMAGHIEASPFMARLREAGIMSKVLSRLPVWLATDPSTGLYGAKSALGNRYIKGEWEWESRAP